MKNSSNKSNRQNSQKPEQRSKSCNHQKNYIQRLTNLLSVSNLISHSGNLTLISNKEAPNKLNHAFVSNLFPPNPSTSNMSSSNNINPFANIKFQSSLTISPPSQHKADTNQAKASTIAENGQLNNYG